MNELLCTVQEKLTVPGKHLQGSWADDARTRVKHRTQCCQQYNREVSSWGRLEIDVIWIIRDVGELLRSGNSGAGQS